MTFRPAVIRGVRRASRSGHVDFRLERRRLVDAYRKGRIARSELCDAHPELMRAALNVGRLLEEPCPICEVDALVVVRYVFGPRLPSGGRCVADGPELAKLAQRLDDLAVYVVEVCRDCGWNHLAQHFVLGRGDAIP